MKKKSDIFFMYTKIIFESKNTVQKLLELKKNPAY
jgi:hypothetical protein